jgi:hypothetical protein
MLRSTRRVAAVLIVAALPVAGCGGGGSGGDSGQKMVWCVAPGEKVTPEFKREYPDLYMPKAACDAAGG